MEIYNYNEMKLIELKQLAKERGIKGITTKPNLIRVLKRYDIEQSLEPELREKYGDRSVLRALHFFHENERVQKEVNALKNSPEAFGLNQLSALGLICTMISIPLTFGVKALLEKLGPSTK